MHEGCCKASEHQELKEDIEAASARMQQSTLTFRYILGRIFSTVGFQLIAEMHLACALLKNVLSVQYGHICIGVALNGFSCICMHEASCAPKE